MSLLLIASSVFIGYRVGLAGDANAYQQIYDNIDSYITTPFGKDIFYLFLAFAFSKITNLEYVHFQFFITFLVIFFVMLSCFRLNQRVLIFILSLIIYGLFMNISFQRQSLAAAILFYIISLNKRDIQFYLLLTIALLIHKSILIFILYLMVEKAFQYKLNINFFINILIIYILTFLIFINFELLYNFLEHDFFRNIIDLYNYGINMKTTFSLAKSILIFFPTLILYKFSKGENIINFNRKVFFYFISILFILSLSNNVIIERSILIFLFIQFFFISEIFNYNFIKKNILSFNIIFFVFYFNYINIYLYLSKGSFELIYQNHFW